MGLFHWGKGKRRALFPAQRPDDERGQLQAGATHFLHDGAPCHKTKKITSLLENCDFEVIDWPGNSPDLNPIENSWNLMKDRLKEKNTISLPLLIDKIKKLWCTGLPDGYLRKLSDSMPDRIKSVIKNKGEMSKY